MIKINVVAVGKIKEKYFNEGISEYSKRLGKYCEFNIIEVAEENFNKVDDGKIQQIQGKEADRILPHLKGYVVVMAIEGKKLSSEQLASTIKKTADNGQGVLTFVIGGSYGLADEIKNRADILLSFSDMTFPHAMFRLMLSEQIYRAFSINGGSAYHK